LFTLSPSSAGVEQYGVNSQNANRLSVEAFWGPAEDPPVDPPVDPPAGSSRTGGHFPEGLRLIDRRQRDDEDVLVALF
jgi:hypothetical protein